MIDYLEIRFFFIFGLFIPIAVYALWLLNKKQKVKSVE